MTRSGNGLWRFAATGLLAAAFCGAMHRAAQAEGPAYAVGDRQFPVTALTDDPFVSDAVQGTIGRLRQNGSPNFGQLDLGLGLEKRITPEFGVEIQGAYSVQTPLRQPNLYGFQNLEAAVKYQLYKSDQREALVSVGVEREFGGTGAARVGAEAVGNTTPTLYFGKGFGDLPDGLKYLRPLAVTGTLGYQIFDRAAQSDDHFPNAIVAGGVLEYSLRYLQGNVEYVGLPPVIGRLTPLVEFAYAAPVGNTFGQRPAVLLAPGIAYSENGVDYAIEAQIPLTAAAGTGVGVIASVHVPLGNLSPLLAKPLFGD